MKFASFLERERERGERRMGKKLIFKIWVCSISSLKAKAREIEEKLREK